MRALSTAALLICLEVAGFAQTAKCHVCEKPIAGKYFRIEDKAYGGKADVCSPCGNLESRCFACGLPVQSTAAKLTDGRFLCARDAKEAIQEVEEVKKICLDTLEALDRFYSRFLTFPN